MISHRVKVYPSKINLPKKKQLAWKIANIASDNAKLNKKAVEMVINRIIDNASVAIASLNRNPVISAREMARIQTFPDEFIFTGRMKRVMWQVGNAVPVNLAKHIGLAIKYAMLKKQII